ncbi:hypothetical protein PVAND_016992 [Polypedilum vanderplanki]|uniref:Uncharacterized protein n=1 Tax=Polypedilum vanderplanki TaxID=319348 RepID=A0A9J6BHP5_POLVA|nr:hypothetical protein PVAND_016992 [Polypedilum vanderplanki]
MSWILKRLKRILRFSINMFFKVLKLPAFSISSNGVADGVYNSAWYKASPKFRKMALMIMTRAQREQKIRAWKFADINLNTFYWVVGHGPDGTWNFRETFYGMFC